MIGEAISHGITFIQELNPRREIFFLKHLFFSIFNLEVRSYIFLESSFFLQGVSSIQHIFDELAGFVTTCYKHFFCQHGCLDPTFCVFELMLLWLNFGISYLAHLVIHFNHLISTPCSLSCVPIKVVVRLLHVDWASIWLEKSSPIFWDLWEFEVFEERRLIRDQRLHV